ncbi:MAG: putative manganese-dependent inorganic diphosphatase [Kiritimatiellae bacterium]|nr:putative manganese-dependent inorganic diphosphatase [Kiritimatiellia bacterium]
MTRYAKIFISGHRNPDVDSVTSAYALCELRKRTGMDNVVALCPGRLPDRAKWVFDHFGATPPASCTDVYLRVRDILSTDFTALDAGQTLRASLTALNASGEAALPVVGENGEFAGLLEPAVLLSQFLSISGEGRGLSLAGRTIRASETLICDALNAETLCGGGGGELCDWDVFVAASGVESFGERIEEFKKKSGRKLIVICGDRAEIHLDVIEREIPLLIVTGDCEVRPSVLSAAKTMGTTIMRTRYDSAKTTRMLKLATPTGSVALEKDGPILQPDDRAHDVRNTVLSSADNIFPVIDNGRLAGVVRKSVFASPPRYAMILVDHNETDQGIPGLDELPVIEVVDHHRIAIRATPEPIKYTADVVGSTCTLVAMMFRAAGLQPERKTAGILLAGLVSDTLLFQSPTTAPVDRTIATWLESICGETAQTVFDGLMSVASPLSSMSAAQAIDSDRKTYTESRRKFSLCQIEETGFLLFHKHSAGLAEAMDAVRLREGLDFIGLLVTDPVRGDSEFLYRGDEVLRRALPYKMTDHGTFALPGVLSRKKQLLPQILTALSNLI